MKKEELRIGNLFFDTANIGRQLKQISFQEDDNEDVVLVWGIEIDGEYEWLSDCSPIPLTEERLLRFGFRKDGNLFFHPDHSYIEFDAYGCNGGFGYCLNDEKAIYRELKYVHRLQNFCFEMTDKELILDSKS